MTPQKRALRVFLHLEQSAELDQVIDEGGLERDSYDARLKVYRLRLTPQEVKEKMNALKMLLTRAYKETEGDPPIVKIPSVEEGHIAETVA